MTTSHFYSENMIRFVVFACFVSGLKLFCGLKGEKKKHCESNLVKMQDHYLCAGTTYCLVSKVMLFFFMCAANRILRTYKEIIGLYRLEFKDVI